MKRMLWIALGALLLSGVSSAAAQSLGEVARSNRKGKTHQSPENRRFDNDNIPKSDHLSVVGPPATTVAANTNGEVNAQGQNPAQAQATADADKKAAAEDRQRALDEWKNKIDDQKQKIESLSHDLDLTQREYRLRAVAMYSDAGNRLRNSGNWDKEDAEFKKQLEEKQKAVDAAKQELETMTEQARKAGVKSRE